MDQHRQQLIKSYQQQLHEKALEITRLCIEISSQGIAHAWAHYLGHIDTFESDVLPAETDYQDKSSKREPLAKLNVRFHFHDFWESDSIIREGDERLGEMSRHIVYLRYLLARANSPTVKAMATSTLATKKDLGVI